MENGIDIYKFIYSGYKKYGESFCNKYQFEEAKMHIDDEEFLEKFEDDNDE